MFRQTFSCLRSYSLPFRMFYLSFFILDSLLPSLAFPPFPLPSDFDLRHPFRPRARCRALTPYSLIAFNLDTGLLLHTTPHGLSLAGHSLWTCFSFPHLSHTLCVACIVSLWTRTRHINTQALLCSKAGNCGPISLLPFACVFRATVAHSLCLTSRFLAFPRLSCRPLRL